MRRLFPLLGAFLPLLFLAGCETAPPGIQAAKVAMAQKYARDRKSTRLNSSHVSISYAVFCLKKKTQCDNSPNTNAFAAALLNNSEGPRGEARSAPRAR